MERSLYYPLKEEGLTTLKIRYDYRTGKDYMWAAKEWDPDIKWSEFNRTFYLESLLTDDDIGLIHSFHENFDMFMPPETGDSIAIPGIVVCMVVSGSIMVLLLANKKKFA